MKKWIILVLLVVFASGSAYASDWSSMKFLVGEWVGEGGGKPGEASAGGFSFQYDLQGKILVRRSFAEYPASSGKTAYRHDDLMIIYQDSSSLRANYFDNEGHTISYRVTASSDELTFMSDVVSGQPRFRFIYHKESNDRLRFEFAIAPPGKPDAFARYLGGSAHRKQ